MVDALYRTVLCRDVEGATAAHSHLANVGALFRARCDHRPHEVARLESLDSLGLFGLGARKPPLVHQAHLSAAMPGRDDLTRQPSLASKAGEHTPDAPD